MPVLKSVKNTDLKKHVKLLNSLNVNTLNLIIMPKQDIHPNWFDETQVYCDGQLIMTTSSTKPNLYVDVWSGNHPFYTGSLKILDTEGRVERFMKKYGSEN
jgi:large subunit ribosomal protein L31